MKPCIKIHNRTIYGETMRPSAVNNPSQHWTAMLANQYQQYSGMRIIWKDGQNREIHIDRDFWRQCENGFVHIMEFIRMHNLDYTLCHRECAQCSGHPACVSMDQNRSVGDVA